MAKYSAQARKNMSMGTRDYDKGYSKGKNERYMSKGMGKDKIMKNHGNTSSIETTDAEQFDLGRVDFRPMMRRGYCMEAYDYKY